MYLYGALDSELMKSELLQATVRFGNKFIMYRYGAAGSELMKSELFKIIMGFGCSCQYQWAYSGEGQRGPNSLQDLSGQMPSKIISALPTPEKVIKRKTEWKNYQFFALFFSFWGGGQNKSAPPPT